MMEMVVKPLLQKNRCITSHHRNLKFYSSVYSKVLKFIKWLKVNHRLLSKTLLLQEKVHSIRIF